MGLYVIIRRNIFYNEDVQPNVSEETLESLML